MKANKKIFQCLQDREWNVQTEIFVYAEGHTSKQHYQIADLAHYGKTMIINGCIQSTQHDEAYYHEALIYPAMVLHGNVKNILCFGGANGGIINRLAHLPGIEQVIQVDIDEVLCRISQHFLPHMHVVSPLSFEFKQYFADPFTWIKENHASLSGWADLIIADLPDATRDSYAPHLFTMDFYSFITGMLNKNGIYVSHAGFSHPFNLEFHGHVIQTMKRAFQHVRSYENYIPSYGAPLAFGVASKEIQFASISNRVIKERINQLPMDKFKVYDFSLHKKMFNISKN